MLLFFPVPILVLLAALALFAIFLSTTVVGRNIYAFRGASADCSEVFFETQENLDTNDLDGGTLDVYRLDVSSGAITWLSGGTSNAPAFFSGASADGSKVFFRTFEQLGGGDTDTFIDVYQAFSGAITLLTPGTSQNAGYVGSSANGDAVFFISQEPLNAADTDAAIDVYRASAGGVLLLSGGGPSGTHATFLGASADGSIVFFETSEAIDAADVDTASDVYQNAGGTISLVTGGTTNDVPILRFASSDGSRVIFDAVERLDAAADVDTAYDVYQASGGVITLLTPGTANTYALFKGASTDGGTVFFETAEPLVGADTNTLLDIYASVGGALAAVSHGAGGSWQGAGARWHQSILSNVCATPPRRHRLVQRCVQNIGRGWRQRGDADGDDAPFANQHRVGRVGDGQRDGDGRRRRRRADRFRHRDDVQRCRVHDCRFEQPYRGARAWRRQRIHGNRHRTVHAGRCGDVLLPRALQQRNARSRLHRRRQHLRRRRARREPRHVDGCNDSAQHWPQRDSRRRISGGGERSSRARNRTPSSTAAQTGVVEFRSYNSLTECSADLSFTGGIPRGNTFLDGANPGIAHPSNDAVFAAGTYAFRSRWQGDSNYVGGLSSCVSLTVNPNNPNGVVTFIHNGAEADVTSVIIGNAVHPLISVFGWPLAPIPTGSVTVRWFTNGTCKGNSISASASLVATASQTASAHLTAFAQTPARVGS